MHLHTYQLAAFTCHVISLPKIFTCMYVSVVVPLCIFIICFYLLQCYCKSLPLHLNKLHVAVAQKQQHYQDPVSKPLEYDSYTTWLYCWTSLQPHLAVQLLPNIQYMHVHSEVLERQSCHLVVSMVSAYMQSC